MKRLIISKLYHCIIGRLLIGLKVKDAQCGFKAMNGKIIDNVLPLVKDKQWFFESELILITQNKDFKICEIPVIWRENDISGVPIIKTTISFFIKGLNIRIRQLLKVYHNEFIRIFSLFSLVGIVSTVVNLVLLYLFLKVLATPLIITYIFAYGFAILLSFILNSIFVFKSDLDFINILIYFTIYISGMLIGTICLYLFKQHLRWENWTLSFMTLPVTMVWNFSLAYKFLRRSI